MIEKITFQNYKLFREEQELTLKPITILIGKNSSGKSAITKLIPIIENSLGLNLDFEGPLALENEGIIIGAEFRDLVYGRYETGILDLKLESNSINLDLQIASGVRISEIPKITRWKLYNQDKQFANLRYDGAKELYRDLLKGIFCNPSPKFKGFDLIFMEGQKSSYLNDKALSISTNYIGPYRFIPPPIIDFKNTKNGKMGIDGGNAYSYLVKDVLYNNGKVLSELSNWYQTNFEGWDLNVKLENRPHYELELVRDNPNMAINFSQVGQGMIQSLPMVLSSFIPSNHSDLVNIFEQPELHLHPAAHGNLAERFANSTLKSSKRYLIETHSQNFVLRLRRMVAEGKLDKDNLIIYYVNFDEEKGESNLREINVFNDGKVDYWPTDVFSETLIETKAIRSAQMKNPYK